MAVTSTNMDTRYLLSNYLPNVTVEANDEIYQNPQIEIFSSTFIKTINSLQANDLYRYSKEHIPVISRRKLGNTSSWWALLTLSSKLHPLLIEQGEILKIPDMVKAKSALEVQNNNSSRVPNFRTI